MPCQRSRTASRADEVGAHSVERCQRTARRGECEAEAAAAGVATRTLKVTFNCLTTHKPFWKRRHRACTNSNIQLLKYTP
ncbi:hypothetical protein RR46_04416 [Papilio xuthus]|uniref:Uncharacterized protein n=1 Tax=Papilio xuthus TaxID=66420 RepID=A0A194PMX7_PAPXU|nr:hypothetical protein RR46_04416 [Papilio xuthus]